MLGPAGPYRAAPTVLLFDRRARRQRHEPGQPRAAAAHGAERHAVAFWIPGSRHQVAPQREITPSDSVVGRARSPGCRPTGATSTPRSSLTSTDFIEPRVGALHPVQPAPRRHARRAALPLRARQAATASRPRWRAAASSAATPQDIAGSSSASCASSPDTRHVATQGPVWLAERQDALMADPVSWLLIEPGLAGRSTRAAATIGRSKRSPATRTPTSSTGSRSRPGCSRRPKYVPAEQVGAITEGTVQLTLDAERVRRARRVPGAGRSRSRSKARRHRSASGSSRTWSIANAHEHRETLVRRIATWFGLAGRR